MAKLILLLLCVYPACKTLVSVYLEIVPAVTYPLGWAIMLAIPLAVWRGQRLSRRSVFAEVGLKRTTCLPGLVSGGILSAVIVVGYLLFFRQMIDASQIAAKVDSLGIRDRYWVMAIFISFWNSFAEEYYWRAFILGQCRRHTGSPWLLCLSNGALFGLHHILVLLTIVPWNLAIFFTFGTVVAGAVWAWHRVRGDSIFDCYLSHVLADLAVLWAGWDLIT